MHTTVTLASRESDAIPDAPRGAGLTRRQVFTYHDLLIDVRDFAEAPGPAGTDGRAARFYDWSASTAVPGPLHSTLIVNRMDPVRQTEVAALFAELDATDFPERMGTRHRQLFLVGDVYLHLQHFGQEDGGALIDKAWVDADPRFIRICDALMPIVPPYDPATWTTPADAIATRVHHWEAA
ncbi:TcmI family type II polyketide cyclase [Streptomyces spectabilis]|uniref:TcmI family type II polyketide cyclase n=1 Tax=Streptomyces spectabilis TaxID=68270 RepID=A0A7W8AY46_STRST|nr:TcmI family type II polyketide cyclase [Streptomyces spectabilis]MBB5106816.1 hypothetical protein [Streptomyces spectabilis]GGV44016.1 hypothetical protein GCM10010245_69050 [Streptomyces spectabilis]